jgi:hypothetical protein
LSFDGWVIVGRLLGDWLVGGRHLVVIGGSSLARRFDQTDDDGSLRWPVNEPTGALMISMDELGGWSWLGLGG